MGTAKFTRRRRRRRDGSAGDTFWPPTMILFLFLLAVVGTAHAENGTTSLPVHWTSSSPSSTSTSSSSSSLPVCDVYVVPSVQRLADELVGGPPLPPLPSLKMMNITTNSSSSFSSSSADLNLNASDLFYPLDYPSDEIEQQQQHPQQDVAAILMDIHHNCPPEVHNENVPAIFLVNGSRSFEGTLRQLKERLLLENADSMNGQIFDYYAPANYSQVHPALGVHPPLPDDNNNNYYNFHRDRSVGSPDDPRQETLDSNQATVFWNVLLLVGYGLILVVSLPGNLLVCRIIISTPKLRTTTNILILSLTVSDIATTIFNIPFMCARTMLQDWPLPDCFCLLMPTVQVSSVYVSTFTMAAIGIHRFRAVRVGPLMAAGATHGNSNGNGNGNGNQHQQQQTSKPSKPSKPYSPYVMTKGKIVLWIVGIWVASIILALPHSLFNQVVDDSPSPYLDQQGRSRKARRCRAMYPPDYVDTFNLILSLETTLTQYLLPLTVTAVLYAKIALIIQRQGQLARHFCDELNRRAVEAKRKRITMLIIVVAAFAISWAPLNFYHLLIDLHQLSFNYSVFMILHQLSVLSVCYNPFIYCWMNEAFRVRAKKYFRVIGKLCPCLRWLCCPRQSSKQRRARRGGGGGGGGHNSRNFRSRLLCGSGGGSGGRRCSSTGTSTIGGGDESYSLSGVGGGAGGGGGGLMAGNNTTATTLTTRVSSFTIPNNGRNGSALHPSASAATIIDTVVDTADQAVAGPAVSSPRAAQWTVQL